MAKQLVLRLAAAALAAALLCGCGTASKSTSTASGRVPAGFALYHGDGFSVAVPAGFQSRPANVAGLPAGGSVKVLTAGGVSPDRANEQIIAGINPNLQFTIDQVATNLREADSTDPRLGDVRTNVRAVTVDGAQGARVVTESYVARYAPSQPAKGPIERTWLMVLPKPGTLIDVVVGVEPARGGKLDPNTVINSFRLGR